MVVVCCRVCVIDDGMILNCSPSNGGKKKEKEKTRNVFIGIHEVLQSALDQRVKRHTDIKLKWIKVQELYYHYWY